MSAVGLGVVATPARAARIAVPRLEYDTTRTVNALAALSWSVVSLIGEYLAEARARYLIEFIFQTLHRQGSDQAPKYTIANHFYTALKEHDFLHGESSVVEAMEYAIDHDKPEIFTRFCQIDIERFRNPFSVGELVLRKLAFSPVPSTPDFLEAFATEEWSAQLLNCYGEEKGYHIKAAVRLLFFRCVLRRDHCQVMMSYDRYRQILNLHADIFRIGFIIAVFNRSDAQEILLPLAWNELRQNNLVSPLMSCLCLDGLFRRCFNTPVYGEADWKNALQPLIANFSNRRTPDEGLNDIEALIHALAIPRAQVELALAGSADHALFGCTYEETPIAEVLNLAAATDGAGIIQVLADRARDDAPSVHQYVNALGIASRHGAHRSLVKLMQLVSFNAYQLLGAIRYAAEKGHRRAALYLLDRFLQQPLEAGHRDRLYDLAIDLATELAQPEVLDEMLRCLAKHNDGGRFNATIQDAAYRLQQPTNQS